MTVAFPLLAAASDNWLSLALWGAMIIVAIVVLGLGMLWARKYAARSMKGGADAEGELTIERLEEMYQSGQITREEFSVLRRSALGLGPAGAERSRPQPRRGEAASSPDPGLTYDPPDVDENRNNEPPGSPPEQP